MEIGLSPSHKLFNRPMHIGMLPVKPQPKRCATKTAIETETPN